MRTKSSIDLLYCRALRADELGLAGGVPALELRDRGLGDHDTVRIDSEIVVADDHARQAVHDHVRSLFGLDVEDDVPARADNVVGPGVVAHDDPAVLGKASRGDEGAAVAGCVRDRLFTFFLIQPGNVVIRQLLVGVERDQVPSVGLDAFALQAGDDSVNLLAIFLVDAGPEHFLGGLAEEAPIALARLLKVRLDDA